jgi:hypothetical protein
VRRNLANPAEVAFFYCHVPGGRPATLTTLVAVAGRRWPVEEDFQVGKDHLAWTTARSAGTPRCYAISC